jgi:hypothetical protein
MEKCAYGCRGSDREYRAPPLRGEMGGRHELALLLEEIRARAPSPDEVFEAVRRAAAGELSPPRLEEIARSIDALFRMR